MDLERLCALGLDLEDPWYVKEVYIERDEKELVVHFEIDHRRGSSFEYDQEMYPVYDHQSRVWEHLKVFQFRCVIHAQVPRVKIGNGKVKLVEVPWAERGSSFSQLYEYRVLSLLEEGMSASGVGRLLDIGAKRIFRIVQRHVSQALASQQIKVVKELSVDETSSKKGHNYLTIMTDREEKKVVGIAVGKDKEAFAHALIDMEIRGADRTRVKAITMDMSRSYISAAATYMNQADIVFDRFHIAKKMNEAVDEIRKQERKQYNELKNSRYLWLRNNSNLTEAQQNKVEYLSSACPHIGKAYRLKELLKMILDNAYKSKRITPLNEWIQEAWASGLEPIQRFVNMLRSHWYGIKGYFKRLSTNAYAERVNLKIQEIKRIAKGYRNINNYRLMIYFHLGGLNLKPTKID